MSIRLAAALLACLPALVLGQQREPPPPPPGRPRPAPTPQQKPPAKPPARAIARDSAAQDSAEADTARKELVNWAEPDSVMRALMQRKGYVATRYQGDRVTFDATNKEINITGGAAVGREQTILVSDTIIFSDSTRIVRAIGDTSVLRDPTQGNADLVATRITYDIASRAGTVSNLSTSVETGQTWYVDGRRTGIRSDSASGDRTFYVHTGAITSCDLTEPHYHFRSKEIKLIGKRTLVARPAVLYIRDIPVMWLPFVFQDLRSGRRSGILPPRFGVSDIVRNSSGYRRHIENIGYYFAISDYMDAQAWLDWRSGARATDFDPGWMRYNAEWRYKWLNRFLNGGLRSSHVSQTDGNTNTTVSLWHQQNFSQWSQLSANLNYATNTTVQRRQSFTAAETFATIRSNLNYSNQIGPLSLTLGGERQQYVGRDEVNQSFPTLSLNTKPISAGDWLVWSPSFALRNSQRLDFPLRGAGIPFIFRPGPSGSVDSVSILGDSRTSSIDFNTPIRIFGFNWTNSFRVTDLENNFPERKIIVGVRDTSQRSIRVYDRTFRTDIEWQTGIELPRIYQGNWNIVPSIQIINATSDPFWVRSELTGGAYVHQSKRLSYNVGMSPTFFGLFPGFGPVRRLRHSISPSLSYSYAPKKGVSDEFLAATNKTAIGYLGDDTQQRLTLTLNQNLEAKLRNRADTNPETARKVQVFQLSSSPLTYDFERARKTGKPERGFTTDRFSYQLRSDLLPGMDLNVGYSLFEGNVDSDTARFKPYRESTSASVSIGRDRNPFAILTRIFGVAVPSASAAGRTSPTAPDTLVPQDQQPPILAGRGAVRDPRGLRTENGWTASLRYSFSRSRPIRGITVTELDPTAHCDDLADVFQRDQCIRQARQFATDTVPSTTENAFRTVLRAARNLTGDFTFNLTPKWSAQWATGYDFERGEFSDHIVTLQRELHDWRAIFAFTQSPNGNFAFNFFISLNAESQLKFDYNRRTYRPGG